MNITIKTFFDPDTSTLTHVVFDIKTKKTAIIDSVLNYDPYSGKSHTQSADEVISYIKANNLDLEWILETHIHADHLSAAHYLRENLGGKIGIGANIKDVLKVWVPIFNTSHDTALDGSQFDHLFKDNEIIRLGNINIKILYTPGHTPACASYLMEDVIFVGDTIFMPDIGTARTDFPGGSAETMYDSIQRILSLPDDTKIYLCHDYPPPNREVCYLSTVKEQKENNILINANISKTQYITMRNQRDEGKAVPKLLLPSIQVNLRAGTFGECENNGIHYIKIPVNTTI